METFWIEYFLYSDYYSCKLFDGFYFSECSTMGRNEQYWTTSMVEYEYLSDHDFGFGIHGFV